MLDMGSVSKYIIFIRKDIIHEEHVGHKRHARHQLHLDNRDTMDISCIELALSNSKRILFTLIYNKIIF
jgi:hypothetical protein